MDNNYWKEKYADYHSRAESRIAELQAYKDVNEDFKTAWEELKAENERLKDKKDKYYQQTLDDEIQINELSQTLQEIKEIAEALSCKHPEDCWENTPDWNGEVYGCDVADNWKEPSELATCPSKLASAILQIITKAEEE